VLAGRSAEGVKVAVLPLTFTVPEIGRPPRVASLKVSVLSVDVNITSEKVTVIAEFTAMLIASLAGEVADTIGGVESAASVVAPAICDWAETFPASSKARTV